MRWQWIWSRSTSRRVGTTLAILLLGLLLSLSPLWAKAKQKAQITPSDVYQQAERVLREVLLLRTAKGVMTLPRDPGVQYNKLPLHVYAKGLEVLEKIAALQTQSGQLAADMPRIPLRKITPGDVFELGVRLQRELQPVKRALGVTKTIEEPGLIPGRLPSDVYQKLWEASFALDGLIPALTPSHVYRNAEYVMQDLRTVAKTLGKTIQAGQEGAQGSAKITPREVLVEAYKNLYRVGRLERSVGIKPFSPPSFPIGKITPSDPFDATSMLLAELVRVKIALNLRTDYELRPLPEGKKPGDVLQQVAVVGTALESMVR